MHKMPVDSASRKHNSEGAAMSSSAKQWTDEIKRRRPLTGKSSRTAWAFLRLLADAHNADTSRLFGGQPRLRIDTIAARLGCSRRTVQSMRQRWEREGALTVERRGRWNCSIYRLRLDWLPPVSDAETAPGPDFCTSKQADFCTSPPDFCTPEQPVFAPLDGPFLHLQGNPDSNPERGTQGGEPCAQARATRVTPVAWEILPDEEQPGEIDQETINRAVIEAGHDPAEIPEEIAAWRRPRIRRTPLPDDWNPSADDRAFARSLDLDPHRIVLAFAAHHRSIGSTRADWSAAFQKWCLDEHKFAPRASRQPQPSLASRLLMERQQEGWA